jgi:hypothetical protein
MRRAQAAFPGRRRAWQEVAMRSSVNARVGAILFLALVLSGSRCDKGYHFVLDMTPTGTGLDRQIHIYSFYDLNGKVWPADLEDSEKEQLERIYGTRPDSIGGYTAKAHFTGIPNDIGNRGTYRTSRTPVGSAALYVERFRGNEHAAEIVARRVWAADTLHGLIRTWLAAELGRQPGWPGLSAWLETELAPRLRDYASAGLMAELVWARESPYRIPTDYPPSTALQHPLLVMPFEHPELASLIVLGADPFLRSSPFFPPSSGLDSLRDHIAQVLSLPSTGESPRGLAFLADHEHAEASLLAALGASRGLSPGQTLELWQSALKDAGFGPFDSFLSSDSLVVRLKTGVEPYETNGTWSAASGNVQWRALVPGPLDGEMRSPYYCAAYWSVPDSALQRRLFGRLLLTGEDLAKYCWGFERLTTPHREEWNKTLLSTTPGVLLPLKRFRFADERKRGVSVRDTTRLSYSLARVIIQADRP